MTKIKLFAGAALALPLVLIAGQAGAQSINYSALQDVFGEPVTTSATGSPQRASEAPVAMDIITAEDIKRSGATDIPTILSRVAGVDVQTWSAGAESDVDVRGYDSPYSPRLLVLVNGRQVYIDDYGYTDWATIPVQLSEIKQIEVVKGPNAALFGFNAVGGVVNIITDNPKYDNTNFASGSAGANGMGAGSAAVTVHLGDRIQSRLSIGALHENQWKDLKPVVPSLYYSNGLIDSRAYENPSHVSANMDTVVELTPKAELRVEGSWSHAAEDQLFPVYSYGLSDSLTNSLKATLNFDTKYGLITADAYQNNLFNTTSSLGGTYQFKNRIIVSQVQDLFKIGSANTFRVGFEYRNNSNNTAPIGGGHVGYNVYAISGMWNWAINSKLALTVAGRYDSLKLYRTGTFPSTSPFTSNALFDTTINQPSANIGLTYKATAVDSFRVSYARGVQVPNLVQLGVFQLAPAPGVLITGTPGVAPTIITSYEVGYDRDLPPLGAKVGISVYHERTDDIQGLPNLTGAPSVFTRSSVVYYFATTASSSDETGVEFTAKGKIQGGYHWNVNWTYTDITDHPLPGVGLVNRRVNYSQLTPTDRGNINLGWSDAKWSADAFVHYTSSFIDPVGTAYNTKLGDYWTLAGHGAYAVTPNLYIGVTVENALQAQQVQSSPMKAERRAFATLSTSW